MFVAAAVLLLGGYFVWDKASTFLSTFGEIPDYPGPGNAKITRRRSRRRLAGCDRRHPGRRRRDQVDEGLGQAVRSEERATSVQAGRYLMKTQMKAIDALRLLINPGSSKIRSAVHHPGGTPAHRPGGCPGQGHQDQEVGVPRRRLNKPKTLKLPKYAKNRPEGFLFPDTYELTADSTATSTLKQMVDQYKSVTREIEFEAACEEAQAVTVRGADRGQHHRTRGEPGGVPGQGGPGPLQPARQGHEARLDSTVIYAEKLKTNTTTKEDRASKSKYNTYRYKGLPPGPISAPGKAALEAAANPEKGKWLYFVTVNFDTGETKFADNRGRLREDPAGVPDLVPVQSRPL